MSAWTIYHGMCDVCSEETESEIEGDVDSFLVVHEEMHS